MAVDIKLLYGAGAALLFGFSSAHAQHGASSAERAATSKIERAAVDARRSDEAPTSESASEDAPSDDVNVTSPYNDPEEIPVSGNGIGPDPDGDTNPATNTRALAKIGDAAEASFDPPYRVVTFETAAEGHGDKIESDYEAEFGVTFSEGLSRQICEGQRYFQYNSYCTYLRAPSGSYAAYYRDDYNRPLRIAFDQPVCIAALAAYPTGGEEGERYKLTLQGYDSYGDALAPAEIEFAWTDYTFRWRNMAGAYFTDRRAAYVDVSMESLDNKKKVVRFLVDDVAFVEDNCASAAASFSRGADDSPTTGS